MWTFHQLTVKILRATLLVLAAALDARAQPAGVVQPAGTPAGMPVSRLEGADGAVLRQVVPPQPRPDQLPPLPVTELDDRPSAADLDGPRKVSLTLSQPLRITEVLMLLVRGTPLSVVTDSTVTGTFIGDLKDLTMRQALEAVLFPHGLDYEIDGNVIRVFSRRPETRLFEVNYLTVRRSVRRAIRANAAVGEDRGGLELLTSVDSDLFDEIDSGVKALLSSTGRSHVDRKAGLVHVTDLADRLDRVAAYLEAVHVRVTRQVRLDVRVFEVSLAEGHGIDWGAVSSRTGAAVRAAGPGIATAGIPAGELEALVKAIAEQGAVRMIAAPQTFAMNNEPAVMRAGINDVYFTAAAARGDTHVPATRARAAAEGLTLTVTPHIGADGIVQLSVAPTWAERTGQAKSRSGDTAPILRVTETDTLVRVQQGETVVLSGLLHQRTEARLSSGFTGFFGAQERRTVRVELVVLLTPTLVVPGLIASEGVR